MENQLIKITTNEEGKRLVSADELREFLEIKTELRKWFPRMCEYGFEENKDYVRVSQKCPTLGGVQEKVDYAITIEMAKELSMIQRTDKGKQARQYFIQCEKVALEISNKDRLLLGLFSDDKLVVAESHKQLVQLEVAEATKPLLETIEIQKPMVEFTEQISSSADSIEIGQFAKLVKDESIKIGRNRLYEWLRDNKYIMKDNIPYQSKIEQGLFEVNEYTYNTPYKRNCIGFKVKITGKGQIYLVEKLRKELTTNILNIY